MEASQTAAEITARKAPVDRYTVRGCYEQLTGGQVPTKYQINKNYCFSNDASKVWNFDGSKSWTLKPPTGSSQSEFLRLCTMDPATGSGTTPLPLCNTQAVTLAANGACETGTGNGKTPDDTTNPVSAKSKTPFTSITYRAGLPTVKN